MQIQSVGYVKSALKPEDFPRDRRPEIAFLGRSNVGKSTLLNTLLSRKGLAKTSATPGKTQTINFFDLNGKFYFVDLPGYGYAKVPKKLKDEWNTFMMAYLREREFLRLAVLLLDSRRVPSDQDLHMLELLEAAEVPTLLVATKIDKLKRGERNKALNDIRKTLDLEEDAYIIPFSALKREGIKELWGVLEEVLES